MNTDHDKLMAEVFGCENCEQLEAFRRSPTNGRFYKFPPIIGSTGEAKLLFIGINPRRSTTNLGLHNWLMESPENFAKLARNQVAGGKPYIAANGPEEHYHCHMMVIEAVFGTGVKFEEVAAVTELMHCASISEPTILRRQQSPCAELYLHRVMEIVRPRVVVAVGSGVRRHLQAHFANILPAPLVAMEHPALLFGKGREAKLRAMQSTIDKVRTVLGEATHRI